MPPTSSRPFACPKERSDTKSLHPKTVLNRRRLHNKRGLELSDTRDEAAFRTAKSRALKKLRTDKGWNEMSSEEQRFAEGTVVRELEEARDAKMRAHELEWLEKLATGRVEPDEADGGEGETAREATSVKHQDVDTHGSRLDNAGEVEARNDSDEWVSDVESDEEAAGLIRKVQEKWTVKINEKLRMIEEAEVNEENEWIATFM